MKKILILLIMLITFSCALEDDTPLFHTEFLAIESVDMPNEFVKNQTYTINLTYNKPTSCHIFKDIYYALNNNESTVAIVSNIYLENSDCQEIIVETETSFNFKPTTLGVSVFKFWQGENTENSLNTGEYLIIEVPVIE